MHAQFLWHAQQLQMWGDDRVHQTIPTPCRWHRHQWLSAVPLSVLPWCSTCSGLAIRCFLDLQFSVNGHVFIEVSCGYLLRNAFQSVVQLVVLRFIVRLIVLYEASAPVVTGDCRLWDFVPGSVEHMQCVKKRQLACKFNCPQIAAVVDHRHQLTQNEWMVVLLEVCDDPLIHRLYQWSGVWWQEN